MRFDVTVPCESLYIHWPFCPYKCHFCPFVALASHDQFMGQYHEVLCKEIQAYADERKASGLINQLPLKTIFIGGGTPSTYPPDLLLDMFGILKSNFEMCDGVEISLEVNPGTVTPERIEAWQQAGINRLSIGVQSLKEDVLHSLNRLQKTEDVIWLLDRVCYQFDSVSVDTILGLPGVSPDEWKSFLARLVQWPLKHISLYFLTVHEDTPLYFGVKKKKITLPPDDTIIQLYYWSIDFLAEHQFFQYEVSNFAKAGFESRHNRGYWERKPYKGFGLGACSFDGMSRFQTTKTLMRYLETAGSGIVEQCMEERLTDQQAWIEKLMLGVRQIRGMQMQDIDVGLTSEQQQQIRAVVHDLQVAGLLVQSEDVLVLTPMGLAVENEIVTRLSQVIV